MVSADAAGGVAGAGAVTTARRLPRFVVAAPASGQGKTTVAIGLMAALRTRGCRVAPAKVGPDYIDPGYHALATGRLGRNLDPFLCSPELMVPLLRHAADTPEPADVAVIEGVMGLYDGRLGTDGFASTAHVARLTESPVLLVVDVRHSSRSVGAVVHGMAWYEPGLRLGGVVLNQVASPRQGAEAARAVERTGIPVLGALPRDHRIKAPSRHLGLVPAAERPQAAAELQRLAETVAADVDLDAVLTMAAGAPDLTVAAWDPRRALAGAGFAGADLAGAGFARPGPSAGRDRPLVTIAGGRAFTFVYPETAELLRAAGCEPVVVDPLTDSALPDGTAGLYLGGGFPQVYAAELAANAGFRDALRQAVSGGLPVVAECAGLLYLADRLDGVPMAGVLGASAAMTSRLTMGYREAVAPADTLLGAAGDRVRGHEFHRTACDAAVGEPAWRIGDAGEGWSLDPAGTGSPTVHASYLHVHWAGFPAMAGRFARAVHRYAAGPARGARPSGTRPIEPGPGDALATGAVSGGTAPSHTVDLCHHGDRDLVPGAVDLAVNVRGTAPDWLIGAVLAPGEGGRDWGAYPDPAAAAAAVAARHGVDAAMVLPTAGAAEAFTLIARGLDASFPVVVHPQFTEPEAALRAAGRTPERHLLAADQGFELHASALEVRAGRADLVVVGNPTNPTGVLHAASVLRSLLRRGRTLVVDEAFMDLVPGEPETLIARAMPGVLVVRSLTKTWGVPGLRAGYVVGDPALVARLAAQQPPWSVSTPALRVIEAASTPGASAHAAALATTTAADRADLVTRLHGLGLPTVTPAHGPFVLVDTSGLGPASVRPELAARGFAVRRGETFPGLGPTWIRVAVRDAATHAALARALEGLRAATAR